MKILVTVKRVVDPYVKIRVKEDKTGVDVANLKMAINPFDEIALEEAIRLKEKNWATEIVVVSVGKEDAQETLRHALALGADKARLIKTPKAYCALNIAEILKKVVEDEKPHLVLMGKQSIDGDNNQTPQMLSALLNWPLATFASLVTPKDNHLEVTREVDGGLETLNIALPAVVSTDLRLNEPRYAALPNIMKAKRKPLEVIELETLDLKLKDHYQVLSVKSPEVRQAGVLVDSVATLVDKLKHEAKVL